MNMVYRFGDTLPSDDKAFMELLQSVCLGETNDAPWKAMLEPANIERTYKAIIDLKNRVMAAISRYNAELATADHYTDKTIAAEVKRKIYPRKEAMLRLHRSVERHVQEAKARRREVAKEAARIEREKTSAHANTNLRDRIRELEAALRLALSYVDERYKDSPDVAQAHVVLEAGGAWWHYATVAKELAEARHD